MLFLFHIYCKTTDLLEFNDTIIQNNKENEISSINCKQQSEDHVKIIINNNHHNQNDICNNQGLTYLLS